MKTRFAPSPTGYLHLGNVRTALFNYLLAHREQGEFLLRIEDTDFLRSTSDFAKQLQEDLRWLGLAWCIQPQSLENSGVYFQSQRQALYQSYYEQLQASGSAYPCFCSPIELKHMREAQRLKGKPPRYNGQCLTLSPQEIKQKYEQGIQASLRFQVPKGKSLQLTDLIKGVQTFNSDEIGDFIIRRPDGSPSFLFCNALDDVLMGITHVLRGEDHVSNTPRQYCLLYALRLNMPLYGHLPLITGENTTPLSKREGSFSLKKLKEAGYLPSALNNYLARLGHHYSQKHIMSLEELSASFELAHINNSSAHFDIAQLNFWQKKAVQKQHQDIFWNWLGHNTHTIVPSEAQRTFILTMQETVLFPEEAMQWAKILFTDNLNLEALATRKILQKAHPTLWTAVSNCLQNSNQQTIPLSIQLKTCLNTYPTDDRKIHWKAIRLALTGRLAGPDLAHIIQMMGTQRACTRLEQAALLIEDPLPPC